MPYRFTPIGSGSSAAERAQVNKNFAALDREAVTKEFKDASGNSLVMGKLSDDRFGIEFSDGTVTFLSITKDGLVLNDGTNDRLLLGKQENGF